MSKAERVILEHTAEEMLSRTKAVTQLYIWLWHECKSGAIPWYLPGRPVNWRGFRKVS